MTPTMMQTASGATVTEASAALFRSWPYVAVGIFVVVMLLRLAASARNPEALAEGAAAGWGLLGVRRLLRAVWIPLLGGHVVALAAPAFVMQWNSEEARLYAMEGVGIVLGLLAVATTATALWRHFAPGKDKDGRALAVTESAFLSLLGIAAVTGVLTAVLYRWGSSWGAATLAPYMRSLGSPAEPVATALVAELPFLARLHVVASFALVAVLPFTRLGTLMVYAVHRAGAAVTPANKPGRSIEAWLRRHNPAAWIWPEEEDDLPVAEAAHATDGGHGAGAAVQPMRARATTGTTTGSTVGKGVAVPPAAAAASSAEGRDASRFPAEGRP